MDHQDIRHKLSEYLDEALSPEERSEIDSHLAVCTECSDALRELRKTIEHIRAVEDIEPPAWMTQKVMARVREEHARRIRKRSFFARFVMLRPIQAVALLALTVTAYYIYLNLEPAGRQSAPPAEVASEERAIPEKPADAKGREVGSVAVRPGSVPELPAGRGEPSPKKALPQSPAYRSLDMKYSYEQPPAPEPAAPPAAVAVRPKLAKEEAAQSKEREGASVTLAPQAAAPFAERSKATADRTEAKAPAAPQEPLRLTLETNNVESTAERTVRIVTDLRGRIVRSDVLTNAKVITADIPSDVLDELIRRLRKLGTLGDLPTPSFPRQDRMTLQLVIQPPHTQQAPPQE